jgi:tripartite-type tricarboxylate transporter receptor subunit TctC
MLPHRATDAAETWTIPPGLRSILFAAPTKTRRSGEELMRSTSRVAAAIGGLLALLGVAAAAFAQDQAKDYPNQPVRIVVPFSAGGATDVAARIVGQKLAEEWNATVIIENKPGATGSIAAEYVAKSKPDGYTLLMGTGSVNSVFPAVKKNLPFDTLRDFVAVSNFFVTPNVLVVHPSVPAKTVAEFIALLKAHPNDYSFASSGVGSSIHLSGELFKQMAGVQMVHVPYKGSAPAVADLVAGHVKVMFDNLASSWPYVNPGTLRALGVTGLTPDPLAPGVPAIADTLPGYDATSWAGLLAPVNTPPAIVAKISASVQRAIKLPDVAEKLKATGGTPVGDSAEHFAKFMKEDIEKWRAVVEKAGVKID